MADQTVPEQAKHYDHAAALEDLRQTAKAASIVRAVSIAVAAQADHPEKEEDLYTFVKWAPSIEAALGCVKKIAAAQTETIGSPVGVDWSTPLSLLEAVEAVFWRDDVPVDKAMCCGQVEDLCEAVLDALSTLHEDLSVAASNLKVNPGAAS